MLNVEFLIDLFLMVGLLFGLFILCFIVKLGVDMVLDSLL